MKYIIDTQAFIWYATGDAQLSTLAKDIIESNATRYISIASIWEMAIKVNIGKLTFKMPFEPMIINQMLLNQYELLPIKLAHTFQLSNLPFHHKDPFDRIIIAQAMTEDIKIVSADGIFKHYAVQIIW